MRSYAIDSRPAVDMSTVLYRVQTARGQPCLDAVGIKALMMAVVSGNSPGVWGSPNLFKI